MNGLVAGSVNTHSHCPRPYKSRCPHTDIVILEYGVNDRNVHVDSPLRRSFERLIRKLLKYPNRPVVAVLSTYMLASESPPLGPPRGGERGRGRGGRGSV